MTAQSTFPPGLPASVIQSLQDCDQALRKGDFARALQTARTAAQAAPQHPEVLRNLAAALSTQGASAEAVTAIERAAVLRPDDASIATTQGMVMEVNGQREAAMAAFRRASLLAPDSASVTYNLGRVLSNHGLSEQSLPVLERTLALAPGHRAARATLAEVLRRLGRTQDAIAQFRQLLLSNPADIKAWSALAALRQVRFDAQDIAAMQRAAAAPALDLEDQVRIGIALAKAYEDGQDYAAAFAAYARANAELRARQPWNAQAYSAEVTAILAAFPQALSSKDEQRGAEVIFIVSPPRSGSTLIEQMLASHPLIEGGDERSDLLDVIAEESQRLRLPLSRWAPAAVESDWRRLGENYLERSVRWRQTRSHFTDKMPGNWLWLGAALAMLPGARVIDCRRDRLETAWSCFCQIFAGGAQGFSYDFASIGVFLQDYVRGMHHWQALHPQRIREQAYEALLGDPEGEVRAMLEFCGLQFDPASLRFYENPRSVRTISASQVREPLRSDTVRTAKYGALLDPLRAELEMPPFASGK